MAAREVEASCQRFAQAENTIAEIAVLKRGAVPTLVCVLYSQYWQDKCRRGQHAALTC